MDAVRAWLPVEAVVPAPLVLADATVEAPFLTATVNWSDAFAREATDFVSVTCGLAVLVTVHEMTSFCAGVTEKEVPEPDGSVVLEPDVLLVQLMELR